MSPLPGELPRFFEGSERKYLFGKRMGVDFRQEGDGFLKFWNLLTSKWVEVSEPAQLARCLQPICHRVTTID